VGYRTVYGYNARDELVDIADHLGNRFGFEYDSQGRKTSQNDPDMGLWTYRYDLNGNLVSQVDARGINTTFSYDELDRILKKDFPTDHDIEYEYDNHTIGILSKISDSVGTTQYYYDNRLRKIQEDRDMDGMEWTTKWTYDFADRITSIHYPTGENIIYKYNNQGLLDQLSNLMENIDYNALGKITKKQYGNGISSQYAYDKLNLRLTNIYTPDLQNLIYQYDDVGNIVSIYNTMDNQAQNFGYDNLDRLTRADEYAGYGTLNYCYNPIGNLIEMEGDPDMVLAYGQDAGPHAVSAIYATATANVPPKTPDKPSGSALGITGISSGYYTSTIDLDGDQIAYTFDWGDGTNSTSSHFDSGAIASAVHIWNSSGDYQVRAMATDSKGASSDWSDPLNVTINAPPSTPAMPVGPVSGSPGTSCSYSTSAADPSGYQISYTFNWGDGSNSTTGLYDSGAIASAAHIWSSSGDYQVRAMATNSKGASSGWSDPFVVSIANPIFGWKALGGVITSSPSAIIDSQDQTEVWVKGGDNALWLNIDGSWQGKRGYLTSDPFAVEDYNGRIHVLARGGDNAAWDFIYDPVSHSGEWVGLGGYITEGLTAAMDPANHNLMRVAARGGDEALWTCDLDINIKSSSWSFQGGVLTSRPYILFDPSGREHILVRGGDNALWDRNGDWTGSSYTRTWSPLGGILANSPVATIEPGADSRIAVFAKGLTLNNLFNFSLF
jgi:YD repeat-containing protein